MKKAKKAPAKKTATKKAPAKKVATKKVATKKVAPKKTAAKKAPVKKTPAKKAPAKKAPAKKATASPLSANEQLEILIGKLEKESQPLFRAVRDDLRKRFPSANELIYDYSHSLVIGFSPNENGIESVLALSSSADGLRLYFLNGPRIPDPKKLLLGSAKQTRFIQVESVETLTLPDVEGFIAAAVGLSKTPFSAGVPGKLVVKTFRS